MTERSEVMRTAPAATAEPSSVRPRTAPRDDAQGHRPVPGNARGRALLEWTRTGSRAPARFEGDTLEGFLAWFLDHGPSIAAPPVDGFWFDPTIWGVTLLRQAPFQAQLYIVPPGTRLPEHAHPNTDTFEVHTNGDMRFYVEGQPVIPPDHLLDQRFGVSRWWGRAVRVRENVRHHLEVGATGAAFVSVQHFKDGVMRRSVGEDWAGDPASRVHAEFLAVQNAAHSEAREGAPHRERFGLEGGKT
jgi:hypothetical protein